jgi:hypothetical protein
LNPKRVKFLKEKAAAGLLVTFSWARAKMGNKVLRMNGQHSSNMLCDLNGSFPDGLQVHLDEYEVKDGNGLANLFRQFDARQSGRSAGDVAGAYQGLFPDLHGVPKAVAKIGVEGVAYVRKKIERIYDKGGDDIYQLFAEKELHAFLQWLGEVFSIKTPELHRTPVVGAMHATFVANEQEARKFWGQVARGGAEYDEDATTSILDVWLRKASEKDGTLKSLTPGEFYQGCVYAWNAYREGKTIKAIKHDATKGYIEVVE